MRAAYFSHDFSCDRLKSRLRKVERAAIGDDSESLARGIANHLTGLAVRQVFLELKTNFGCNVAFEVVADFRHEIRAANHGPLLWRWPRNAARASRGPSDVLAADSPSGRGVPGQGPRPFPRWRVAPYRGAPAPHVI